MGGRGGIRVGPWGDGGHDRWGIEGMFCTAWRKGWGQGGMLQGLGDSGLGD
jgi:hypothetical protein